MYLHCLVLAAGVYCNAIHIVDIYEWGVYSLWLLDFDRLSGDIVSVNSDKQTIKKYWHENIRLLLILLSIWFLVSFVFGILLVDQLNAIQVGGFKLGFWFSQQGSIYTFVVLIFIYVVKMNKLDHKYNVSED